MLRFGLPVAALVAAVDQVSKDRIRALLDETGGELALLPFFKLVERWNPGVSFSMFNSGTTASRWILTAFALAVVVGLAVWLARVNSRLLATAIERGEDASHAFLLEERRIERAVLHRACQCVAHSA